MFKLDRPILFLYLFTLSFFTYAGDKEKKLLDSYPSGAEVYNSKDEKIGTTPFDMHSMPRNSVYLILKMDGYESIEIKFKIINGSIYFFQTGFPLCDTCKVESKGNNYNYELNNPVVKLRKVFEKRDNRILVCIDDIVLDSSIISVGKINTTEYKVTDKTFDPTFGFGYTFVEVVLETMKKSSLRGMWFPSIKYLERSLGRPRIVINPVIKKLNVNYLGDLKSALMGIGTMEVEWKFSTVLNDSVYLGSMTTQTKYFNFGPPRIKIIETLLREATLDWLGNDTLYNYIERLGRDYLLTTKGEPVKIDTGEIHNFQTLKEGLKNARKSVVSIISNKILGSGFIISPNGYIVTNYHVVRNDTNVKVGFTETLKVKAKVIKTNPDFDLALLKIDTTNLSFLNFASSENLESGDFVYAIGTPLDESLGQTITSGIVSALRNYDGIQFIQTDVSINKGNSGGPLINEKAGVIGITTLKAAGEGIEGIGFCIPSDVIVDMLNIKL